MCGGLRSLNPAQSEIQQRQLAIIAEYISDIGHINRDQKVISDCPARPTLAVGLCDLMNLS